MPTDHFPSTHATWIDAQLTIVEGVPASGEAPGGGSATAARAALRAHLMERYYDALRTYVRSAS